MRLVRRLDPETAMQAALWLLGGTSVPGLRELILAVDGKVARRSGNRTDGLHLHPLHMAVAFLVREGLTLAQEPCDAKSNEITAIPRLLDRILEGAVVTIDAVGCQRDIVQALREADADYVLAVKRNQQTLHQKVKAAFDDAERGVFAPAVADRCETIEHYRRPPAVLRPLLHHQPIPEGGGPVGPRARPLGGVENGLHRPLDMHGKMTSAGAGATRPPSWASYAGPP